MLLDKICDVKCGIVVHSQGRIRELSICTTDDFCGGKTQVLHPHHDGCQVLCML